MPDHDIPPFCEECGRYRAHLQQLERALTRWQDQITARVEWLESAIQQATALGLEFDGFRRELSRLGRLNERSRLRAPARPLPPLSAARRQVIYDRDGHRCRYCGERVTALTRQVDHVVPASRGGTNDVENLVTACVACNRRKGSKTLSEAAMTLRRR